MIVYLLKIVINIQPYDLHGFDKNADMVIVEDKGGKVLIFWQREAGWPLQMSHKYAATYLEDRFPNQKGKKEQHIDHLILYLV